MIVLYLLLKGHYSSAKDELLILLSRIHEDVGLVLYPYRQMAVRPTSVMKNLRSDSTAKLQKNMAVVFPETPEVFKKHCYVHLTFRPGMSGTDIMNLWAQGLVNKKSLMYVDVLISSTGPATKIDTVVV